MKRRDFILKAGAATATSVGLAGCVDYSPEREYIYLDKEWDVENGGENGTFTIVVNGEVDNDNSVNIDAEIDVILKSGGEELRRSRVTVERVRHEKSFTTSFTFQNGNEPRGATVDLELVHFSEANG